MTMQHGDSKFLHYEAGLMLSRVPPSLDVTDINLNDHFKLKFLEPSTAQYSL